MKSAIFLLCLLLASTLLGQISSPYALWSGSSGYIFGTIDPSTGVKTHLDTLATMTGLVVPNTECINPSANTYTFLGSYSGTIKLTTLDLPTGNVLYDPIVTDNIFGLKYNCQDDSIYCLFESTNNYSLVTLDPVTGNRTVVGNLPGVSAHIGSTFTLNPDSGWYSFQGLLGTAFTLFTVDMKSGNILYSNAFAENIPGQHYNCNNDTVYGLWENQSNSKYYFCAVDVVNGSFDTLTVLPVSAGFISESSAFNPQSNQYSYRGFIGLSMLYFAIDVSTLTIIGQSIMMDNSAGFAEPACCSTPCPAPVAAFGYSSNQLALNFTDSSSSAGTWQWTFGDGSNDNIQNPSHTYANDGLYEVCLSITDSCGTDSICDSVSVISLILAGKKNLSLNIYPNPTSGKISISWIGDFEKAQLELLDLSGRKISAFNIRNNESINLLPFPKGMYFLKLNLEGKTYVQKIQIMR